VIPYVTMQFDIGGRRARVAIDMNTQGLGETDPEIVKGMLSARLYAGFRALDDLVKEIAPPEAA
jgi:hypothetical protein